MHDLNDLSLFAEVVRHGSFSAASRASGIPKSRLSRRIATLEQELGVQLLRRTTRQVRVTPIGEAFYERCRAMLAEAEAAREVVMQSREQPTGALRVSCPFPIAQQMLAPGLGRFLAANPGIQLELDATNRRVDVIGENYDIAIRVRDVIEDSSLIAKPFARSEMMLVASPHLLDSIGRPRTPDALQGVEGIGQQPHDGRHVWHLNCGTDQATQITYAPRLVTDEFTVLLAAAVAGVGVAMLPRMYCREAIDSGELEVLLPQWHMQQGTLHAVYSTRKGMTAALRRFLDFLTETLPGPVSHPGTQPPAAPGMNQPLRTF